MGNVLFSSKIQQIEYQRNNIENTEFFESSDFRISEMDKLSPEILEHIFSYVPALDLIKNARLVCRRWGEILNGYSLWKRRCVADGNTVPEFIPKENLTRFYTNILLKNPYGRNLVRNPCGQGGLQMWQIESGGDGWQVEDPPAGALELPNDPELAGASSCFATSYNNCIKRQMIDLLKEGWSKELLQTAPPIKFLEWHAARFDCGSVYNIEVILYSDDFSKLDTFKYNYREEQWAGNAWYKVEHVFRNYGKTLRYIKLVNEGKDTQFWAGHFGSKVTGTFIKYAGQVSKVSV